MSSKQNKQEEYIKYYDTVSNVDVDWNDIPRGHIPITPQMLRAAVKKLQMRKCYVDSKIINEYLRRCYPVQKDIIALKEEVAKKLDCAVHVGLLVKHGEDSYCLPTLREEANSLKTMISEFWETYENNNRVFPRKKMISKKNSVRYKREKKLHFTDNDKNI